MYKIHSSRLRKSRWNLSLPLSEARKNDEVISLADSQILRWIDELNGITDADERASAIKREIRSLRKESGTIQNRRKIKKLYSDLDDIQYKPDYLCLVIDRIKDYHRACDGFYINDIKYVRLLGTNGGIKNSTVVFVSERHADELRRRINNGRDESVPLVPAKLEAYRALTCSASTPVSMPNGILVVNDCEVSFITDIVHLSDDHVDEPVMELRSGTQLSMDASDGYGLMLPSLAKRWSEELKLDYMMSGCNTRFSWEKGMVFTFDFLDFAENVAHCYIVKDAWGNEVDIRDVELVLTVSMVKLWDSYKDCDSYVSNSLKNGYTFGVAKTCPKGLECERNLNYQFIQSYDLSEEDIDELIAPTMHEIDAVLHGDWRVALLYLKGIGLTESSVKHSEDDFAKAIMANPEMFDDPFVKASIYSLIRKRINEAKVGVVKVHGNYSIVSGDPYALCQSFFGMEVTGLLKAGEIYSKYWVDYGANKLACFRAPMSTHSNIRLVHPVRNNDIDHWYKYMTTCTIFNAWDTASAALNGMDYDGDLVMLTDNNVMVSNLVEMPALMCEQRRAIKVIPSENDLIKSNIDSFGNDIGQTTNWVTSMFEVRSHFAKDSSEYNELTYRIQCGQLFQQNAIEVSRPIQ